uniref:RING finger domain protein n=1 Tax=Mycena chlorophos TaxID=658473 RepID=A0ABQ0MDC2_MYCCL|nr:RING finger domain protein [Mycena chlorophos]
MSRSGSHSRSPKRARIATSAPEGVLDDSEVAKSVADDEDRCSICLQSMLDRTVVPICSHEFCFDCLLVWTGYDD